MRYYNEDPQVKYWREKYDSLKIQNEQLKNDAAHLELKVSSLEDETEEYRSKIQKLSDKIDSSRMCIHELEMELRSAYHHRKSEAAKYMEYEKEVIRKFNHFNSLPWYKKMFYKFKL